MRGIIDEADTFISSVVIALNTYRWKLFFNINETSVMINNRRNITFSPLGIEDTIIIWNKNEKECFTCIGSCSRYKKYDLFVLSMGTTN